MNRGYEFFVSDVQENVMFFGHLDNGWEFVYVVMGRWIVICGRE